MREEHYHIWKYNEAEEVYPTGAMPYWKVYRFCTDCLEGEEIELKANPQSKPVV